MFAQSTSHSNLMLLRQRKFGFLGVLLALIACGDEVVTPDPTPPQPTSLSVLGRGDVAERYTAEVNARGNIAYTTTWNVRTTTTQAVGNAIKIWNIAGDTPVLVDSVLVAQATTLGDVQVSDDGKLLFVATEVNNGSFVIYDLANPVKPVLLSRFNNIRTNAGVHTAEVQRVNGVQYAFLSIDPRATAKARLVILDLSNPAAPTEIFTAEMGSPYVHDVFVRAGLLFTAVWDDGVQVFDIGGGGKGGSPSNPVLLGSVKTVGGQVHNIWWYHDATGGKRYAFIGQEGPGTIGASSAGDIHVIDVSNFTNMTEVAFFSVLGAGTHNFFVDESKGILYAAYYNAGVQALDVTGNLSGCTSLQRSADGRCDLTKMGRLKATGLDGLPMPVYVWGVQVSGGNLYASDMLNGLWKLRAL